MLDQRDCLSRGVGARAGNDRNPASSDLDAEGNGVAVLLMGQRRGLARRAHGNERAGARRDLSFDQVGKGFAVHPAIAKGCDQRWDGTVKHRILAMILLLISRPDRRAGRMQAAVLSATYRTGRPREMPRKLIFATFSVFSLIHAAAEGRMPATPSLKPERPYASSVVSTQDAGTLDSALRAAERSDWREVARLQRQGAQ